MVLVLHILIALASLGFATFTYFKPSTKHFGMSYGLIVATVASGTALLLTNPGSILHTCLSGMFYITVVSIVTIATHVRARKLARESIEK
jgi:hypothetical protein